MKCSNCGNDNVSGSNYCTQCNYSLVAAPTTPTAPAVPATPTTPTTPATSTTPTAPTVTASTAPAKTAALPYTTAPNYAPPGTPVSHPSAPAPTRAAASAPSAAYQQPYYYYQPVAPRQRQPFTITDALIIIGFVLAIIGIFAYAFILLPASIAFSVTGFLRKTNPRTQGLSIAGIVVGVVACLVKVGMVLYDLGFIPEWLSAGIFR